MLNAVYGEGTSLSSNTNRFTEKVTGYDKNGNILGFHRYGQTGASSYGLIDNLTFTLESNRLNRVDDAVTSSAYNNGFEFKDAVKQENEYAYDANGNLTKNLNRNISNIQYNFLNLPGKVTFGDGSTIEYVYAADGTKLRTKHVINGTTTTTDYCGDVVYENGVQKLLLTEAGYVTLADKKYHYYLTDHQGNNRVVLNQNGTVEEVNHYYPFGGLFASSTNVQPYKYNGKELDTKNGLNWYDYGARHYDPALGRFTTIDPMAEKYYSMSAYAYCGNNPVKYIDPDGKKIVVGTFWQRIGAALGLNNFVNKVYKQLEQNNADSRRISSVYQQLENSELEFRILPLSESPIGDKKGNYVKPDSKVELGKKQGGTMYYNPDMEVTPSGEKRTARIGLAHEMGHFEDLLKGKMRHIDPKKYDKGNRVELYKKELNEQNALELENIIRGVLNYEKRESYYKNRTGN